MKKIALILTLLLAACGAEESSSRAVDNTSESLLAYLPADAEKQDEEMIGQLLDIPADSADSIEAYFSSSESEKMLIIVRTKDSGSALDVQEKMKAYVTTLENSAALYNPDQLDTIRHAYVNAKGNMAVLAICDDIENAEKALATLK